MASFTKIGGKWRAQVRRKAHKPVSRYFDTKKEAEEWARQVEAGIDQKRAVVFSERVTVSQIASEYRRIRLEAGRPIEPESNQHYMLDHLADDLGPVPVVDLKPDRLVRWARLRKEQGAGPYTVNMELSQLGTALRYTASFLGLTLPDVVGAARPLLHHMQLIGGGKKRTRRPTEDELSRLLAYLDNERPQVADAVRVAAITGMRRGEIARIKWTDLDHKRRTILVRHRKHPRRIEARDEWVPLLGEAWDIVNRQSRQEERIFPVSRELLTDSVTNATKALGIPNLHLNDMRREAASRLREKGFDTDERKAITGHRSDEIHERYIAVTPESLHAKYAAHQDKQQRLARRRKDRDHQP